MFSFQFSVWFKRSYWSSKIYYGRWYLDVDIGPINFRFSAIPLKDT